MRTMEMTVDELAGGALCVALQGRLDTVGVDQVEPRFSAAVAEKPRHAAIDLRAVTFLASMGVRMIIATARAQRARGFSLVLFGAQPLVKSTLEMVALDQIIPVLPDLESAQARLAG
jgi:anti-sigma B factor antagonist